MKKVIIARHIKNEFRKFANLIEANKEKISVSEIGEVLRENGYEVMGRSCFNGIYVDKDGLRFYCARYSSEYTLHVDYGFYVGSNEWEHGTYIRIFDVDERIDDILNAGYVLPENHYVRPVEIIRIIAYIKAEIQKAKELVRGGYGEIGDKLRSHGYFVSYDGGSVCNFSKGYMCFRAYCEYGKGWYLEDDYDVYLNGTDNLSDRFSLDGKHERFLLDSDFEAIFGGIPVFGRRVTEKERIGNYKRFSVRTYGSRRLDTIGYYDTFEEAKEAAYEKAKELAANETGDRRRYAYQNPLDVSDKYDYLAAYVWYMYDRGSEHMVFVQGEN